MRASRSSGCTGCWPRRRASTSRRRTTRFAARTTAYLVALAEACRDLGGRLMVLGSPKQRSRLPGVSREQAFDLAAETLRPVLPVLESAGVTLCLEPLVAGRDRLSEHVRRGAGAGGAARSPERRAASRRESDGERADADRRSRRARTRPAPAIFTPTMPTCAARVSATPTSCRSSTRSIAPATTDGCRSRSSTSRRIRRRLPAAASST